MPNSIVPSAVRGKYAGVKTQSDWMPMLVVGEVQFSLYMDGSFEARSPEGIFFRLDGKAAEVFLKWIDERDR